MKTALRIAALFAVYSSIGYGGDYAVSLLGHDAPSIPVEVDVQPVAAPAMIVDVQPTIVTRVQVRHSGACEYELDRELTVPLRDITSVRIDHGSGALHVEGRDDVSEIILSARVCASHAEYVDQMLVAVRNDGGTLELRARYPEQRDRSGGQNVARIDVTLLIPAGLDVEIDDSSGDIVASGTGDLTIDDSSGSVDVFDIHGSLSLDDSSGDVEIRDVRGDVSVEDGSGSVEIVGVGGAVILRDGSGGVDIRDVDDSVLIEEDGSGGIEVSNVRGDFEVLRDGSGGIRHSGVEGRVDVPRKKRRR